MTTEREQRARAERDDEAGSSLRDGVKMDELIISEV